MLALLARHPAPICNLRMHGSNVIARTTDGWLFAWSLKTYQRYWARKAHDHAVTAIDVYKGMVVSGGKDGGGYEDACGLDAWVRVWKLDAMDENAKADGKEGASSLAEGDEIPEWGHDPRCVELGGPAQVAWRIGTVPGKLVALLKRGGGVVLELWTDEEETLGGSALVSIC